MKSQYIFVLVVIGVILVFFLIGSIFHAARPTAQARTTSAASSLPSVQVSLTPETIRPYDVALRGRTEASRTVVVRSETAGVVAQTPAREGAFVSKGDILCRLAVDARQAALDQARAALRSRQLQRQASVELAAKGYRSQTQVLEAQSALDGAQANVRQAEIALAQVNIRAPFSGVFDKRDAETGAYLAPGQSCGTVIELDPLLVVGDVPETDAAKLRLGATATARLVSGQRLSGRVRYVAHDADPQTRTYHVEIAVANPRGEVRSGLSADVRIAAGSGSAHLVPISAMVLDSAGRQGVRLVGADDRARFAPVTIVQEDPAGAWVTGLKGPVRLITVGQSYVADGQKVRVGSSR